MKKGIQAKMKSRAERRQSITAFHHYSNRGLSCDHCKLIDNGDVAMYQVTCPKCGEIPPGRRHLYPNITSSDVGAILYAKKHGITTYLLMLHPYLYVISNYMLSIIDYNCLC